MNEVSGLSDNWRMVLLRLIGKLGWATDKPHEIRADSVLADRA